VRDVVVADNVHRPKGRHDVLKK